MKRGRPRSTFPVIVRSRISSMTHERIQRLQSRYILKMKGMDVSETDLLRSCIAYGLQELERQMDDTAVKWHCSKCSAEIEFPRDARPGPCSSCSDTFGILSVMTPLKGGYDG